MKGRIFCTKPERVAENGSKQCSCFTQQTLYVKWYWNCVHRRGLRTNLYMLAQLICCLPGVMPLNIIPHVTRTFRYAITSIPSHFHIHSKQTWNKEVFIDFSLFLLTVKIAERNKHVLSVLVFFNGKLNNFYVPFNCNMMGSRVEILNLI